jgi:hypothetical protein
MLQSIYLHPGGQIPAYEWNFSDVNPPVHAWASIFLYRVEEALRGEGDIVFLKQVFAKLMLNFNWWVNRKDRFGKNVFEGGFLGLDNIGVFDRGAVAHRWLSGAGRRHRVDGAILSEHGRDRGGVDRARFELRGHRAEIPRPYPVDRARHESDGSGGDVG